MLGPRPIATRSVLSGFASVILVLACSVASASPDRGLRTQWPVERVAGCTRPVVVWHVEVEGNAPCNTASGRCSPPPLFGLSRRVEMKCDTSFQPDRTKDGPFEVTVNEWSTVAARLPECFTQAVANGPGMTGVVSASCVRIEGRQPTWGTGWSPEVNAGVVALRSGDGLIVGSGFAIAPNLVLTAKHVLLGDVEDEKSCPGFRIADLPNRPIFAVAGHILNDTGRLTSIAEERGFRLLPYDGKYVKVAESPLCMLDFVVLGVGMIAVKSRDAEFSNDLQARTRLDVSRFVRPKNRASLLGESVNILAYTANAFFPRGLIASTDGQLVPCNVHGDQKVCGDVDTFFHYNLQTTPGFSGAPVFSDDLEWIALHQRGLSVLDADTSVKRGIHRDFSRPNRGVSAQRIVESIARQLTCEGIDRYEFRDDFRAWLKSSIAACE